MVKLRPFILSALSLALVATFAPQAVCQVPAVEGESETLVDPFDPFDLAGSESLSPSADDKNKSVDQLLREAQVLLGDERLLDARTKLLKALQKDPDEFQTYYLLAGYYTIHVGHYRLALKYIKRAEELFEKKHGPPPYKDNYLLQAQHGSILFYLSQIRLNLDNYQGALDVLDRYTALGYSADWYPGSRAWILMKLGEIKEAIRVARMGVLAGADAGRTLNMLGILLSMNGQPSESLDVFRRAIATEMALGSKGQPATPLNNAGEVYRELFDDERAESTFLRATSLPDGCEHVLPSLNLALLYIEQMKFDAAATAMNNFQHCVAQYPLRNGEEHIALVNLARGRVDLHTGHVDRAIQRFESALEGTQWFGKIGTNQNDLEVAATISLAQALERKNNHLKLYRPETWTEWLNVKREMLANEVRAWWLMRRARQILAEDLNDIEDLSIRNTDSLIEYPTFGEVLSGFSRNALANRIDREKDHDSRPPAQVFYEAYLAESDLGLFSRSDGLKELDDVISRARPKSDELLRTHAILRKMRYLDQNSVEYRNYAYRIFLAAPAELRNYGFRLPVTIKSEGTSSELTSALVAGPFLDAGAAPSTCTITANKTGEKFSLRFACPGSNTKVRTVEDSDPNVAVNKLSSSVFSEEITNGGNS